MCCCVSVGKIAVCGDVAEMFRDSNMHSQRFLWWDKNDDSQKPSVYVMRALTFSISCAPCIAHYIRDFNAEEFKEKYPRAVEAIQQHYYVDDFIDSAVNVDEAVELTSSMPPQDSISEIRHQTAAKLFNIYKNVTLKISRQKNLPILKRCTYFNVFPCLPCLCHMLLFRISRREITVLV